MGFCEVPPLPNGYIWSNATLILQTPILNGKKIVRSSPPTFTSETRLLWTQHFRSFLNFTFCDLETERFALVMFHLIPQHLSWYLFTLAWCFQVWIRNINEVETRISETSRDSVCAENAVLSNRGIPTNKRKRGANISWTLLLHDVTSTSEKKKQAEINAGTVIRVRWSVRQRRPWETINFAGTRGSPPTDEVIPEATPNESTPSDRKNKSAGLNGVKSDPALRSSTDPAEVAWATPSPTHSLPYFPFHLSCNFL